MSLLPSIGAEKPCSMLAINTPIQIRTALVTVDFRGGYKQIIEKDPDDPANSVRMKMGFKLSAELPGFDGDGGGGTITLEQKFEDSGIESRLRVLQDSPPKLEQVMVLRLTMTIDQPNTDGEGTSEPLVLVTRDPAVIIGEISVFPPRGDEYKLRNPVDFVLPDAPDVTVAVLQKLPAKTGGF
ncbi:hypothetical protein OG204_01075 [Streptomyces sp. NBC_01387]|uniref:hypothetical protein n=1 Tax=Streptomyces sp. NBC_01387 TaxID=2903849 RepID=UPI003244D020